MMIDETWHTNAVEAYAKEQPNFKIYAMFLNDLLQRIANMFCSDALVQARDKRLSSFAEKAVRKMKTVSNPSKEFTDLCGGRVITQSFGERDAICQFVRANFYIDEANSDDTRGRLRPDQFGYTAIHYIIQMWWDKPMSEDLLRGLIEEAEREKKTPGEPFDTFRFLDELEQETHQSDAALVHTIDKVFRRHGVDDLTAMLQRVEKRLGVDLKAVFRAVGAHPRATQLLSLWPDRGVKLRDLVRDYWNPCHIGIFPVLLKSSKATGRPVPKIIETIGMKKAEVQVKTLLEHAWAAISHDRVYKSEFEIPDHFQRDFARLAALLEEGDKEFNGTVARLDAFKLDYGAYMKPEQIRDEIAKGQLVLKHATVDNACACRIARLAVAVEDWDTVIETLEPFLDRPVAEVHRHYGQALAHKGSNGEPYLLKASRLDPRDYQTFCLLGELHCGRSPLGCPGSRCENALHYFGKAFEVAPEQPGALGRFVECKACHEHNRDFVRAARPGIEQAIAISLDRVRIRVHMPDALYDAAKFYLLLDRYDAAFAAYAKAILFSDTCAHLKMGFQTVDMLENVSKDTQWRDAVETIRCMLLAARPAVLLRNARHKTGELEKMAVELARMQHALKSLGQRKKNNCEEYDNTKKKLDETVQEVEKLKEEVKRLGLDADTFIKENLAPRVLHNPGTGKPYPAYETSSPVVIVAGGCDASVDTEMKHHQQLFNDMFSGFRGTVISAGTTVGIGQVVGEIPDPDGHIRKVGYLPASLRRGIRTHPAYEVHEVPRPDFSVMDVVQTWIDLLANGVRPADVRLFGVNGGDICAMEYRIALALGAVVGVMESSGRSVTDLRADGDWLRGNLLFLPEDPMTFRAFVNRGKPQVRGKALDAAGRAVHDRYVRDHFDTVVDPRMQDWTKLRPDLKRSNIAQASYATEILRTEGFVVEHKKTVGDIREYVWKKKDEDAIRRMAEKEHGRWNVERLQSGWSYGAKKDVHNKKSPYLVPWNELTPEIREYDIAAVRQWPQILKQAKCEICAPRNR